MKHNANSKTPACSIVVSLDTKSASHPTSTGDASKRSRSSALRPTRVISSSPTPTTTRKLFLLFAFSIKTTIVSCRCVLVVCLTSPRQLTTAGRYEQSNSTASAVDNILHSRHNVFEYRTTDQHPHEVTIVWIGTITLCNGTSICGDACP